MMVQAWFQNATVTVKKLELWVGKPQTELPTEGRKILSACTALCVLPKKIVRSPTKN